MRSAFGPDEYLDRWLAKCMIAIISCLLFRHQANLDVMTLTSDESPIEVGSNRKASTRCHFTDSEFWNMNWAILCYTQPNPFYSVRNFYIQWSSVSLWSVPRQTDRNLKKATINFHSLWISIPKFFSKDTPMASKGKLFQCLIFSTLIFTIQRCEVFFTLGCILITMKTAPPTLNFLCIVRAWSRACTSLHSPGNIVASWPWRSVSKFTA